MQKKQTNKKEQQESNLTDMFSLSLKMIYFYTFIHSYPEFSQAYAFIYWQLLCPILYFQKGQSDHSLD